MPLSIFASPKATCLELVTPCPPCPECPGVEDLQNQIDALLRSVTECETMVEAHRETIKTLEISNSGLEQEIGTLQQSLEDCEAETNRLQIRNAELEDDNSMAIRRLQAIIDWSGSWNE